MQTPLFGDSVGRDDSQKRNPEGTTSQPENGDATQSSTREANQQRVDETPHLKPECDPLETILPSIAADIERLILRYETAWEAKERPEIESYVRDVQHGRYSVLCELVQIDLEYRLKSAEAARVEEYFVRFPELAEDREFCLQLIVQEYSLRRRTEARLSGDEYLTRFPQWGGQLIDVLVKGQASQPAKQRRFSARLNCPHCNNAIEIVSDSVDEDVLCPSCGSAVHLNTGRTLTWNKQKLPVISQFELIEAVGRGAFGTVYKARDQQLQRIVAVKIPRSGVLETDEDEDRFVREARNVAQLQHPGIVAIHSVGRSDTFPYLVSEFIDGVTLSQFLTSKRLSVKESAKLIRDVSLALQHAHLHGVVHRDLKPSNIMITAEGSPRITDFGIAKRDAGEITMTLDGQILGTPAYMSPEQARGESHEADARSDIYSVGVILFQLLTGELPFRGDMRMLLHQVIHDEPPSPRKLNHQIPRDLETICVKCLAKEPKRRYASARELADEVQRYLDGRPIHARPLSHAEHVWLWCRRNPVIAVLSSAAVGLLFVVTIVSTFAYLRESRLVGEKDELLLDKDQLISQKQNLINDKEQLTERAEHKAEEAKQTVRFLQDLFRTSDPLGLSGAGLAGGLGVEAHSAEMTARDLLSIGIQNVDTNAELGRYPLVRASLLDTLGSVQSTLGFYEEAEPRLIEALQIREKLLEGDHEDLAESFLNLGLLHQYQGRFEEAEGNCRQALRIQRLRFGSDDARIATTELILALTIGHRFDNQTSTERLNETESLISDAIRIRRKNLGPKHRDVGLALIGLAAVQLSRVESQTTAIATLGEASSILGPTDLYASFLEYALSRVSENSGAYADAIRRRRNVLEKLSKVLGIKNPVILLLLGDLAGLLKKNGELDEAERVIRQVFDAARRSPWRWHQEYAKALIELGIRVRDRGDTMEAKELLNEALEVAVRINSEGLIGRCRHELSLLK